MLLYLWCLLFSVSVEAKEFSPERPDAPDNAVTIGKGEFYIEPEMISHRVRENKTENVYMQTLMRYGVTDRFEMFANIGTVATKTVRDFSVGDASLNARVNHFGSDGSWFELSTIYGVVLPLTNASDTDWGTTFSLPFAFNFPHDFYLATTISYLNVKLQKEKKIASQIAPSIALFKTFGEDFDLFVQAFGSAALNDEAESSSFYGGGIAWRLNENFQLDLYSNIGVNEGDYENQYALGFATKL